MAKVRAAISMVPKLANAAEDAWTVRDPRFSSDVGESSRGGKANETNVSEGGLSDTGTLVSSDEGESSHSNDPKRIITSLT